MIPDKGNSAMVENYKVITCSPVGRKRYVEIQVKYLLQLRDIIDKHIFWINTKNESDLKYFDDLIKQYPNFFEKKELDDDPYYQGNLNVGRFYKYYTDKDTVYCKIDDDIVFMQLSKFKDFIKFRIQNPQYFLVYANTINSGLSHFIHNKFGAYENNPYPPVEYLSANIAYRDWQYATFAFQQLQKKLTNDELDKFDFGKWILSDYERHSINFISWLGSEFSKIDVWGVDDEQWLSVFKPGERVMPNCIYGGFLVAHYAFFTQRDVLDKKPEILNFFKKLSENIEMKS